MRDLSFRSMPYDFSKCHMDTWGYLGDAEEYVSVSRGGLSPCLREMWRRGMPTDIEVGTEDEEASVCAVVKWRHVLEGPFWESIRACMVPVGVLNMRSTSCGWNVAGLYGACAELYVFLVKKEPKNEPVSSDDKSVAKYDYSQLIGHDSLWRDPTSGSQM